MNKTQIWCAVSVAALMYDLVKYRKLHKAYVEVIEDYNSKIDAHNLLSDKHNYLINIIKRNNIDATEFDIIALSELYRDK